MSTDPRYHQQLQRQIDQAAAIIPRLSDEDVARIADAVVRQQRAPWPDGEIVQSAEDDARTRAALAAYQEAMRREATWRQAVRAALVAYDG